MSNKKNKKKMKDAGETASGNKSRPAGWHKKSHSNDVDPNYAVVFPGDVVNTMTITITPDDWAAMQSDMEAIYARSLPIREAILAAGGTDLSLDERTAIAIQAMRSTARPPSPKPESPTDKPEMAYPHKGVKVPQVDDAGIVNPKTPMWVPATITFRDQEWTHVGVRYKGVSSSGTWVMGEARLPFKLKFDKYEDDHPEIENQRFFGFRALSLANNTSDPAGMRDASEGLSNLPLDKPSDKEKAPLIGFLLDDPVYFARYKALLAQNYAGAAAPEAMIARVQTYAKLIAPAATKQMTQAEYDDAVQAIVDYIERRAPQIEALIAAPA